MHHRRALRLRYGHAKWRGYESREFAAHWPIEDLASTIEAIGRGRVFSVQDLAKAQRGPQRRQMDPWTAKRSIDAMVARGLVRSSAKGYRLTSAGQKWVAATGERL